MIPRKVLRGSVIRQLNVGFCHVLPRDPELVSFLTMSQRLPSCPRSGVKVKWRKGEETRLVSSVMRRCFQTPQQICRQSLLVSVVPQPVTPRRAGRGLCPGRLADPVRRGLRWQGAGAGGQFYCSNYYYLLLIFHKSVNLLHYVCCF